MSIVWTIPWIKVHEKHMEHEVEFYALNKAKHNLERLRIFYRGTHQAQAKALFKAREVSASHILFTEDDHYDYPPDGLDILLAADKPVIGFQTYFKKFPFNPMNCRLLRPGADSLLGDVPKLKPFNQGRGAEVQKTDLITWAFTLVRMDVFDKMDDAGLVPFRQWGPHPTDSFFCQYCREQKIPVFVHFGHTIGHGNVEPKDINLERRLFEERHPEARIVTLEDDHGNIYGTIDHVPEMTRLQDHFAKPGGGRNGNPVDEPRNGNNRGDPNLDPDDVPEFDNQRSLHDDLQLLGRTALTGSRIDGAGGRPKV